MRKALILIITAAFIALIFGIPGVSWVLKGNCASVDDKDLVAGCAEFIIFRYQTLIGIAGAILAAFIAARPVWLQLSEMKRQNDGQTLEYLRKRSVELDHEAALVRDLFDSVFRLDDEVNNLEKATVGGSQLDAAFYDALKKVHESIKKYEEDAGPLWCQRPDIGKA
jgi:hypothetical protein